MSKNWDNKKTQNLVKAILALKNAKEAKSFLRDLLTAPELNEFGNRWLAAQRLDKGVPYSTIQTQTGLSSTTIARISKWLKKGRGGYGLVISRFNKHRHNPKSSKKGLRW